jgi:hypothetical protein
MDDGGKYPVRALAHELRVGQLALVAAVQSRFTAAALCQQICACSGRLFQHLDLRANKVAAVTAPASIVTGGGLMTTTFQD